jgi:hypothetical protein
MPCRMVGLARVSCTARESCAVGLASYSCRNCARCRQLHTCNDTPSCRLPSTLYPQWLIDTETSINQGDTTWSDLLAEVLRALHNGNDATGGWGQHSRHSSLQWFCPRGRLAGAAGVVTRMEQPIGH